MRNGSDLMKDRTYFEARRDYIKELRDQDREYRWWMDTGRYNSLVDHYSYYELSFNKFWSRRSYYQRKYGDKPINDSVSHDMIMWWFEGPRCLDCV